MGGLGGAGLPRQEIICDRDRYIQRSVDFTFAAEICGGLNKSHTLYVFNFQPSEPLTRQMTPNAGGVGLSGAFRRCGRDVTEGHACLVLCCMILRVGFYSARRCMPKNMVMQLVRQFEPKVFPVQAPSREENLHNDPTTRLCTYMWISEK